MFEFALDRFVSGGVEYVAAGVLEGGESEWCGECGVGDDPGVVVAVAAANTPTIHVTSPSLIAV